MKTRLPKIIFFETHDDPTTSRIIAKLIPVLKELGYLTFFEESPRGKFYLYTYNVECKSLHQVLETFLKDIINEAKYLMNKAAKEHPESGLMLDDAEKDKFFDRDEFLQGKFIPTEKYSIVLNLDSTNENSRRESKADSLKKEATKAYLLSQLIKHDIEYLGIDDPDRPCFCHVKFDPIRDYIMASAHVATEEQVIGRNGLSHVKGIQTELVSQLSHTKAYQKFICFYLYSIPLHDASLPNDSLVSVDGEDTEMLSSIAQSQKDLLEYERGARNGTLDLPLGLITIDASKHTDDQVITMIVKAVKRKAINLANENNTVTLFSPRATNYCDDTTFNYPADLRRGKSI